MQAPLKSVVVVPNGAFGAVAQPGTGLPDANGVRRHIGVDLRASVGTPVYALGDGKVTLVTTSPTSGNKTIEIVIGGFAHRFLHLSAFKVAVGDTVKQGQLIALSGNSGGVLAHLHWDVRKAGTAWNASFANFVDPMKLIKEEDDVITNDPSSRDALRIGHSEAGGWNFAKTHAGEYDQLFMSAWQGKTWPEFLYAQWLAGAPWRDYRTKAIAFYEQWKDKIPQLTSEDDEEQIKEALASLAGAEAKAKAAQAKLNEALND